MLKLVKRRLQHFVTFSVSILIPFLNVHITQQNILQHFVTSSVSLNLCLSCINLQQNILQHFITFTASMNSCLSCIYCAAAHLIYQACATSNRLWSTFKVKSASEIHPSHLSTYTWQVCCKSNIHWRYTLTLVASETSGPAFHPPSVVSQVNTGWGPISGNPGDVHLSCWNVVYSVIFRQENTDSHK
jgi:hypothetical protein